MAINMGEFDEQRNQMKAVTGPDQAASIVTILEDCNIKVEKDIGGFLGIAAGKGFAEVDLARRLNISDITLVDRDNEIIPGYHGQYVQGDMFDFMNKSKSKFSIITMFAGEHIVKTIDEWNKLWDGIANVSKKNSVIVIMPYKNGFKVPHPDMFKTDYSDGILVAQKII